jgi:phospholipase C
MVGVVMAVLVLVGLVAVPGAAALMNRTSEPPPVGELSAIPASGTAPLTATFDGMGTSDPGGTLKSWTMNFGDGSALDRGKGAPPDSIPHRYTKAGFFTATLTAKGSQGSSGKSTFTVTVDPPAATPPTALLGVSAGSGVAPLSVRFDGATSTVSGASVRSWSLSFGDDSPVISGSGTPPAGLRHSYRAPGVYTASLSVTSSAGRSATGTADVSVLSSAAAHHVAGLGVSAGSGSAALTVQFAVGSGDVAAAAVRSWRLSFGDGSSASGAGVPESSVAHTYGSAGSYTATLSLRGASGTLGSGTARVVVSPAAPVASMAVAPKSTLQGIQKIQHVVIIMQENRSFDSYFGTFPGADGIPMSKGVPTVCVPDPRSGQCVKPYHDTSVINNGGGHDVNNALADIDGGKMDGFIARAEQGVPVTCSGGAKTCPPAAGSTDVMGYHTSAEIPNYWDYASHFLLNDHMFESNLGWSLPSHLGLVSLWSATCTSASNPESCTSSAGAVGVQGAIQADQDGDPTTLGVDGSGGANYPWTDLTWLLHRGGVSWQYFVGTGGNPDCETDAAYCEASQLSPVLTGPWNPLPDFDDVKADGQLGNIVADAKFYPEAAAGTLPSVSWVVPVGAVSEHPDASVTAGMAYTTSLINSVMEGPDWDSTAIFLAWDDWGGFYDNVAPPDVDTIGYGLRVPAMIISPYVNAATIDHQNLSFDAYAKFIEDDFLDGQRLDPTTDGRPDSRPDVRENEPELGDIENDFNFNQPPLAPYILNTGPPWGPVTATDQTLGTATGRAPLRVAFNGSSSSDRGGHIFSWTLSYGDGTPAASGTGAPPSDLAHTYQRAGTFHATMTVTNTTGQSASTTATIEATYPPPVPVLQVNPPGGQAPADGVAFNAAGSTDPDSTITSWSINFGDGSAPVSGTGAPPDPTTTHTYSQAGDYGVTLTLTDANGATATLPYDYQVSPALTLSTTSAPPTGDVDITGVGYQPGETVNVTLDGQPWGSGVASSAGTVTADLVVPASLAYGAYQVVATGTSSDATQVQTLNVYANWQFRNGPGGGSVQANETTINASNVSTLVPAPWEGTAGGPITSSPAVINGNVYVGSQDGTLRVYNPASYEQWRNRQFGSAVDSSPALFDGIIYFATDSGEIYGIKDQCGPPTTGSCPPKLLISTGSAITATPAGTGKAMYFGDAAGKFYLVNARNTTVQWTTTLSGPVQSSAAVSKTVAVVGAGNDVYALNNSNGSVRWESTTGGPVTSSPVIYGGNTVYVGSQDGNLYGFKLQCSATCAPEFTVKTGGPIMSSPAIYNGMLYVGSNDGDLYAISLKNGKVAWTVTTGGPVESSPAVANGVVYFGSNDGKLYAVNAAGCGGATSCSPLWTAQTGGAITSSPAVSDGVVYVGSSDDHLYAYELPSEISGAEGSVTSAAIACPSPATIGSAMGMGGTAYGAPIRIKNPETCNYVPGDSATDVDTTNVSVTIAHGLSETAVHDLALSQSEVSSVTTLSGLGTAAYLDTATPGDNSVLYVSDGAESFKISAAAPAAKLEAVARSMLGRPAIARTDAEVGPTGWTPLFLLAHEPIVRA